MLKKYDNAAADEVTGANFVGGLSINH